MKQPVFSFEAELLTDAPFDLVAGRLRDPGPAGFRCLRALQGWQGPATEGECLVLRWSRNLAGSQESGALVLSPDPKGAHLRLEGRLKGWTGFLLLGWLRWRTDRLLDRFVGEL
ncbi:hypothetical protein [Geothrix sp. SG200]|uniref:hypothetical protein n=1 Tax=Geothrix sp. SG200 TaxID=2922865 RepID=UPI001FACB8B3|nr:hypothetical protein [Geothrix sp. SG200]